MVDAATKLAQARARESRAAVHRALQALVADLVATTDGRWYRQVLEEMPERDWFDFSFELRNALAPSTTVGDVRPLPRDHVPSQPAANKKRALLAEEHRKRQQLEAGKRVEKVARMDVPGVT